MYTFMQFEKKEKKNKFQNKQIDGTGQTIYAANQFIRFQNCYMLDKNTDERETKKIRIKNIHRACFT